MREIVLTPKEQPRERLEAEVIRPDLFAGKEPREIEELEIFYGNAPAKLGEFFDVSGGKVDDPRDLRIVIEKGIPYTKRVGQETEAGEILIRGDVDLYVGARMKGGKITVEGNVGSFAGQQMKGGELHIQGNAGDYLGASYRGDWKGMSGGLIVVEGSAGSENAEFMRGGRIHIKGDCGPFAGLHMKKGLILIDGDTAGRVGAQMMGGNIVVRGKIPKLLPGFRLEGEEKDPEIDGEVLEGSFLKYSGDHAERNAKGLLYYKK
jgi:formylmethanofuran dehydrogenase subunit C